MALSAEKRARLIGDAARAVEERWGSIEAFEKHFNAQPGPTYIFRQAVKEGTNGRVEEVALLRGDTKIVLDSDKHDSGDAFTVIAKTVALADKSDLDAARNRNTLGADIYHFAPPDIAMVAPIGHPGPLVMHQASLYPGAPDEFKVRWYCSWKEHEYWDVPGLLNCPGCGEKVSAPKCPGCGAYLIPGRGAYCKSCGIKLPPQLAVPEEITFTFDVLHCKRNLTGYKQKYVYGAIQDLRSGRNAWTLTPPAPGAGMIWHLQTRDERTASDVATREYARTVFAENGTGTIIEDPYMIQTIKKLVAEYKGLTDF